MWGLRMGLGLGSRGGVGADLAIFTIAGTGATNSTLYLFFPTSEGGKTITATGSVKFGESGNETTHTIAGNATNAIKVWCPNAETGTIILPNTYTRFSANTSDNTPTNGWATQTGSPSITFSISSLPSNLIIFRCSGSNTISGALPSDWKSMTYFLCTGSNTISGALPSDWKSLTTFYCTGSNTISGIAPGTDAFTSTSMSYIFLDPTTGGLSVAEQSRILILMATKTTWSGTKSISFYAPCASMADTAADGIWDYTDTPTALAAAVKTLVRTYGIIITVVGVDFTTGGGLPSGFVGWLNS